MVPRKKSLDEKGIFTKRNSFLNKKETMNASTSRIQSPGFLLSGKSDGEGGLWRISRPGEPKKYSNSNSRESSLAKSSKGLKILLSDYNSIPAPQSPFPSSKLSRLHKTINDPFLPSLEPLSTRQHFSAKKNSVPHPQMQSSLKSLQQIFETNGNWTKPSQAKKPELTSISSVFLENELLMVSDEIPNSIETTEKDEQDSSRKEPSDSSPPSSHKGMPGIESKSESLKKQVPNARLEKSATGRNDASLLLKWLKTQREEEMKKMKGIKTSAEESTKAKEELILLGMKELKRQTTKLCSDYGHIIGFFMEEIQSFRKSLLGEAQLKIKKQEKALNDENLSVHKFINDQYHSSQTEMAKIKKEKSDLETNLALLKAKCEKLQIQEVEMSQKINKIQKVNGTFKKMNEALSKENKELQLKIQEKKEIPQTKMNFHASHDSQAPQNQPKSGKSSYFVPDALLNQPLSASQRNRNSINSSIDISFSKEEDEENFNESSSSISKKERKNFTAVNAVNYMNELVYDRLEKVIDFKETQTVSSDFNKSQETQTPLVLAEEKYDLLLSNMAMVNAMLEDDDMRIRIKTMGSLASKHGQEFHDSSKLFQEIKESLVFHARKSFRESMPLGSEKMIGIFNKRGLDGGPIQMIRSLTMSRTPKSRTSNESQSPGTGRSSCYSAYLKPKTSKFKPVDTFEERINFIKGKREPRELSSPSDEASSPKGYFSPQNDHLFGVDFEEKEELKRGGNEQETKANKTKLSSFKEVQKKSEGDGALQGELTRNQKENIRNSKETEGQTPSLKSPTKSALKRKHSSPLGHQKAQNAHSSSPVGTHPGESADLTQFEASFPDSKPNLDEVSNGKTIEKDKMTKFEKFRSEMPKLDFFNNEIQKKTVRFPEAEEGGSNLDSNTERKTRSQHEDSAAKILKLNDLPERDNAPDSSCKLNLSMESPTGKSLAEIMSGKYEDGLRDLMETEEQESVLSGESNEENKEENNDEATQEDELVSEGIMKIMEMYSMEAKKAEDFKESYTVSQQHLKELEKQFADLKGAVKKMEDKQKESNLEIEKLKDSIGNCTCDSFQDKRKMGKQRSRGRYNTALMPSGGEKETFKEMRPKEKQKSLIRSIIFGDLNENKEGAQRDLGASEDIQRGPGESEGIVMNIIQEVKSKKFKNFQNPLPLKSIYRIIKQIYEEKLAKSKTSKVAKDKPLAMFAYDFYKTTFGFEENARKKFIVFLLSLKKRMNDFRINMFSKFMGLNESDSYTSHELWIYLEGFEFLETNNLGSSMKHSDGDGFLLYPYLRAVEYIRVNFGSRMSGEELSKFLGEIEGLKRKAQGVGSQMKRNGLIDGDVFMERVLRKFRLLVMRTKDYVINAFAACDLDGNGKISLNEFIMLVRHIEPNKFDLKRAIMEFTCYVDSPIEAESPSNNDIGATKNMSLDNFVVLCSESGLFSVSAVSNFIGEILPFQNVKELAKQWPRLKKGSVGLAHQLKDEQERGHWVLLIEKIETKIEKLNETSEDKDQEAKGQDEKDILPILIAHKMLNQELERLMNEEEDS